MYSMRIQGRLLCGEVQRGNQEEIGFQDLENSFPELVGRDPGEITQFINIYACDFFAQLQCYTSYIMVKTLIF